MGQTMFEVQCSEAKIGVQVQLLRNEHFQCPFDIFVILKNLENVFLWQWFCKEFLMILNKNFQD